ncbi:MAG: hypothetical protein WKG07_40025 [Hymenobacter sp.]
MLRLYNNFFQPSVKLVSKERKGSQVTKKYDKAQTPYQRVLAATEVSEATKESLQSEYEQLDPVELLRQVEHHAKRAVAVCTSSSRIRCRQYTGRRAPISSCGHSAATSVGRQLSCTEDDEQSTAH